MQLIDGRPVYSATDLVGFLACEHLTNLELAARAGLVERPMRVDPELDRVVKRGYEHEARFLADRRAEGLSIVEITPDGSIEDRGEQLREAAARTLAAMRDGTELIYQATFFDGRWRGHADFLRRVEVPSDLGPWSYEVWDTKLARHVKGSAVLQLSLYTDMLATSQGHTPAAMHVALGGSARTVEHLRVEDYAAYFRLVRGMFDTHVEAGEALPAYPPATRPDPVEHCDVCRWSVECRAWRREHDDLSLVAGIGANQRRALRGRDVDTLAAFATATVPFVPPLDGTSRESVARTHAQAAIQLRGRLEHRALHELIPPSRLKDGTLEPNRGLLGLPRPSPGDLFFDIEGDPFALDDGIDYLFGVLEPGRPAGDGSPTFRAIWSIDGADVTHAAEQRAFEQLIDLFMDRLARDPDLHIYHYAPYEPTAIGRLMGRYGTREREVDRLLRGDVFVDLFRAVRQGVRASVESYSIKKLEPLYGFTREVDLRDAGSSIVAFETWLELGGDNPDDPDILGRIEAYNRDDCVSTRHLRDWLESLRPELAASIAVPPAELPRPVPRDGLESEKLNAHLEHVERLTARLVAGRPEGDPQMLLGHLLSWHRREAKSSWWRFYYLRDDLTDEERIEEPEPIGGLEYVGVVGEEKQSLIHRYRFPTQEHDIDPGRKVTGIDADGVASSVNVRDIDEAAGTIDLIRGKRSQAVHPRSLIPDLVVSTDAQEQSLLRIGEWVADHDLAAPGPYRAVRELLLRRPPRFGHQETLWAPDLQLDGEEPATAARRLVLRLDESYLAIQGPPGSGKTTTGAEMIVDLVKAGKRVGVTSNSHKVIGNLLRKAAEAAARRNVSIRIGQKPNASGEPTFDGAIVFDSNDGLAEALRNGTVDVAGATAWAWAREEFTGIVDVLFVDEAGQVSLANVVAVGAAARNLVLLGDPQQLDQPIQGSHPPGADRSALAHLLRDEPTMPGHLGLFLDGTWRLHPEICEFTSRAFYEGRLTAYPDRERQVVTAPAPVSGAGLRWIPVEHPGDSNESADEARAVASLISRLLDAGAEWTDDHGITRHLTAADVVIVTPYNAQVREIGRALTGANVGTVDKFQGQEAPISVYSMATSSAEDAPRGMEFLYNLHRLNVATSRARSIALIVASPELIRVRCRTPRQMELANGLARFVEMARSQAGAPGDRPDSTLAML